MADVEKKLVGAPVEIAPEGQGALPKAETVESKPAAALEAPRSAPEKVLEQTPISQPPPAPPLKGGELKQSKDELTQEIEEVLAEDLDDLYKQLPADKRQKFKQEGEKTAGLIRQLMAHGKFHGRRILGLIVRWLKLIPGVNKFFLEQESKIKTDKLQLLAEEENKKRL